MDWDAEAARAAIRTSLDACAVWYDALDPFDRPCLTRREIAEARRAVDAAFHARDLAGVHAALDTYERTLLGVMLTQAGV